MRNFENNYKVEKYNTMIKKDISNLIVYFLEDLMAYNLDNEIFMSKKQIQKAIDKFKEEYLPCDYERYYSESDEYERITDSSNITYFKEIVEYTKK